MVLQYITGDVPVQEDDQEEFDGEGKQLAPGESSDHPLHLPDSPGGGSMSNIYIYIYVSNIQAS